MTPFVRLDGVSKRFDAAVAADGITLAVERGEVLALLGPSGSGKTTLLRLLAGFEQPDAGRMIIDGADVGGLSPARRRCGMGFQPYALFPHLDVGENVAFGLRGRGSEGGRVAIERQGAARPGSGGPPGFEPRPRAAAVGWPPEARARLFVATFVGRANVFRGAAARALGGADGQVAVVRPEAFRFSEIGIPGVVKERRYTGAAALYLVDGDRGERFEVLAAPGAARVGDRVFVEATRLLTFAEERQ